jgi:hypothetical protein
MKQMLPYARRRTHAAARRAAAPAAAAQRLEPRRLLATVAWDGGGDGTNWFDARNWSGDAVPTAADDVVIDVPAQPQIVIGPSADAQVRSLVSNEHLLVDTMARMSVATTATLGATLTNRGSLAGGVWQRAGDGRIESTRGTFESMTLDVPVFVTYGSLGGVLEHVTFPGDTALLGQWRVRSRLTVNGTLTTGNPDGSANGGLWFTGADVNVLDGIGSVVLGTGGVLGLDTWSAPQRSLTIESGIEVYGTSGHIRATDNHGILRNRGEIHVSGPVTTPPSGQGAFWIGGIVDSSYVERFINEGKIIATAGAIVDVAGVWTSTGTMHFADSTVRLGGQFTSADLAGLTATGSRVTVHGLLDMRQVPLSLTYPLSLYNGRIIGPGEINDAGGGRLVTRYGTLSDLTLNVPVDIEPDGVTNLRGTFNLNNRITGVPGPTAGALSGGTINVGPNVSISAARVLSHLRLDADGVELPVKGGVELGVVTLGGRDTRLVAVGSQTVTAGVISFESPTGASILIRDGNAAGGGPAPATLTLTASVRGGRGRMGPDLANVHPAALVNRGSISANLAGAELLIDAAPFTNAPGGTVEATNGGTLRLAHAPTNFEPATRTLRGGSWRVGAGSTLSLPESVLIAQNAADVALGGAGPDAPTFAALSALAVNDGTLTLAGGYDHAIGSPGGDFTNNGLLKLDPDSLLTVPGDYRQSAAGAFEPAVGGPTADRRAALLSVVGRAALAGTLRPVFAQLPRPALGDAYEVVRAAAVDGRFDAFVQPLHPSQLGRQMWVRYGPTTVTVAASPPPPGRLDLVASSDTGGSSSDNITTDATPTVTGVAPEASLVRVISDGEVVAEAAPAADGSFTVTLPPLADGTYLIIPRSLDAEGDETASFSQFPQLTVTIDTAAPSAAQVFYRPAATAAAPAAILLRFEETVAGVEPADLAVYEAESGRPVNISFQSVTYDGPTRTAVFQLNPGALPPGNYRATLRAAAVSDPAGSSQPEAISGAFDTSAGPAVAGRHVSYYRPPSGGGHGGPPFIPESYVLATDKRALRPGEAAGMPNVTSYSRGINSLMADLTAYGTGVSLSDFRFEVGDGTPGGWRAEPPVSTQVQRYAGVDGSDRIVFRWRDGTITNAWLRVTVLPSPRTGLAQPDAFYFGNVVGETGDSTTGGRLTVTTMDVLRTRRAMFSAAGLDNRYDFNRDGRVTAQDYALVRSAAAQRRSLALLDALAPAPQPVISPPGPVHGSPPADDDESVLRSLLQTKI